MIPGQAALKTPAVNANMFIWRETSTAKGGPSAPESQVFDQQYELSRQEQGHAPAKEDVVDGKEGKDQKSEKDCYSISDCRGSLVDEPPHCRRNVRHPAGEAPFIVIPGQNATHTSADDLGLVWGKDRRMCGVVEVD